jgi:hypothetical protein
MVYDRSAIEYGWASNLISAAADFQDNNSKA